MNPIVDELSKRLTQAMKDGDRVRIDTLRSLRAAVIEYEKSEKDTELTHETFLDLVLTQIKRRRDAIEQYRKGGRSDLAEKEERELAILQEFLPTQLSQAELESEIRRLLHELGATKDTKPGTVIGSIIKQLKGRADNATISATVVNILRTL